MKQTEVNEAILKTKYKNEKTFRDRGSWFVVELTYRDNEKNFHNIFVNHF